MFYDNDITYPKIFFTIDKIATYTYIVLFALLLNQVIFVETNLLYTTVSYYMMFFAILLCIFAFVKLTILIALSMMLTALLKHARRKAINDIASELRQINKFLENSR